MSFHVLILRLQQSAPTGRTLMAMLLALAVGLLVQQLRTRRGPAPAGQNRMPLLALPLVLLGAFVSGRIGYQGQSLRDAQLRLAQSAPVRIAYGNPGAPAIQVFTAPGCGPCRRLEARLGELIREGYAVQYIPVSMDGDWGPLEAAMCGADPRASFEAVFAMAAVPPPAPGCHSRVRENQAVQQALGSRVYPTVIMPDGLLELGAPPIKELRDYLHATAPLPAQGKAL